MKTCNECMRKQCVETLRSMTIDIFYISYSFRVVSIDNREYLRSIYWGFIRDGPEITQESETIFIRIFHSVFARMSTTLDNTCCPMRMVSVMVYYHTGSCDKGKKIFYSIVDSERVDQMSCSIIVSSYDNHRSTRCSRRVEIEEVVTVTNIGLDYLPTFILISYCFFVPESIHISIDETAIEECCLDIIDDKVNLPMSELFLESEFIDQTIESSEPCDLIPMRDRDDADRGSWISWIHRDNSVCIRDGEERGEHSMK